ncbi:anaerobic dimethyl sulfoxide reductase subunit B (iron-sulfur subunit) [Desulfitobacterium sp. LBE]|uniref:4Fe-4S binding domain protein n=5 Tax=root TaxID=1 RepID=A0A098B6A2_DESHA|nr:anaerobic dimethyl sulfoxide reductase subunit B (iron-sulfur subunit) [Desulfitobacterium sp. LBE]BAE85515.1 putative oxidoreductase iron-sulfur subunit [Desulfitobacterium hafniense Y51]CDX03892.1 4Fe-4S binding domain protein [Desulfitobacterium hafniense]
MLITIVSSIWSRWGSKMNQKGFVFNPNRCLGCRSCQTACSVNHNLPPGITLRKVTAIELAMEGRLLKYYLSSSCNHCLNPECFRLCPNHAYRKRRDGIVVFDEGKCKGCGTCIRSCPFEAPVLLPDTGKVIKCDLCFAKLEEGEEPFCIGACPVGALKLFDPSEHHEHLLLKVLPGIPRIQVTRPAARYHPLKIGKQVGLQLPNHTMMKEGSSNDSS